MDRQHLFEKKPFAKWYHKCMTCKKRKMWASMIKCVYCKKYRHSECKSSDQCQSPVAPGLCTEPLAAENTFDTITTPPDGVQQWYLDVKSDDGGNLGSGQESIKGLVKENPITAKRYMTITEEWIVRESITVVDKMRPIDKNTKSTNIDSPKNIISTTITEQEASGSGIQTVEKTKNSDNSTLSNVKESTISYRQTTETDMNTSFTNDKSTTTGQKPTDTGVKITNTNEKSTNTDVEFSNTNENTRITEKKTTDIGIGVNKSNAVDKAKQSDNNRPTTAEKLTTSDKKTIDIGVNTSFINEKSTTISQKPTGTGVKMTKTNEKLTNTDVDSSDTDENMTNTYMKIPDYVEESITIDKKPINISIQTSTRIKESITFEKKGNLADNMVTKDDWKTLTTEKKPIQTDKMTQTTEENNIKTNQKTSDTEKKPINTNKTNADTEKKSIKSIKKTLNNVEKTKKMDKKPPTTSNKKTPTTADQKTRTTTDKKSTSIAKKTPTTAEKLIITSDKKRIFICTKRFANEEQSYTNWPSPCFSELKLTSVDAERCTNDCNTFEKEEWSGNYVMTHRRSAKESQPSNTLELHSCSSAEYFPNTVLQRRGCLVAIRPKSCVQPNEYEYFMESVQMCNYNEQQSLTKTENDSSDLCAAMAYSPDDDPDGARQIASCPADPVAQTSQSDFCCDDDDFDVGALCDKTTVVSQCVGSPECRRMIGPVSTEESIMELAQLFPETDDEQFCGFFFGGQTSFDL